jgi:HK97 family phage major capsid protein
MTFKDRIKRQNELLKNVNTFWNQIGEDEPSAEQKEQVKDWNKELETITAEIAESKEFNEMRERHGALAKEFAEPVSRVPVGGADATERKSMGERFAEDSAFHAWLKQISSNGIIPENFRVGNSPPVDFKTLITGVSDTSGGALVRTDYRGLVELPFRPLMLRDIVTQGTTESDTIEYPRVTGYTNNAAPVAEATATSGGTGAKPESGLALEKVTTNVKTIAHWVPATKRALSDAGQIRTLIDSFLRYGLEEELEDQMVNGDGTGENFTGFSNVTGLGSQAYDTSLIVTSRKARTKVKTEGRAMANGYLMHPLDWEAFDLLKDGEDRYYFGGPLALGNPRLWGLPVIESEAATQGVGYVGDFRQLVLWDREQASIRVSDSHSDFFVRNLVAILGESRHAFGVFRPAAIIEIDLTA